MILPIAATAAAQRSHPRMGVAAQPRPPRQTGLAGQAQDPNVRDPRYWPDNRHQRVSPNTGGSTIIYVPVPSNYGYGYGYDQGGYYPYGRSGVYDVNGRSLSSYDQMPSAGGYGYTPDLSGSSYAVTDEGMMVVDFASGQRRAFPSCAAQTDLRDPDGHPRTIFYQSTDYWMVLRPGQRGRVQGDPPANVKACYAIDSVGRVVLRY
jgi:hypothetical protein